jgi:hypothetical protein
VLPSRLEREEKKEERERKKRGDGETSEDE